ncbi:MAG: hypothetical protein FWF41_08150 [Betaproteobacteria bacterium]|nr:hypothetical protein [Betaproteobacteria bacterium]
MKANYKTTARKASSGFMLIEVFAAIMLFALGIVSLVAIQARSVGATDDVQYRAEAVHLANAYMGQMWASGMQGKNLVEAFQTDGAQWQTFRDRVIGANGFPGIPGGQPPTVTITDATVNTAVPPISGVDVTITISWAGRDGITMHNYVQTSSVGY